MGINQLRPGGVLTYISPQQYLILDNCRGTRDLLRKRRVVSLADFARAQVFTASTYTFVSIIKDEVSDTPVAYKEFNTIRNLQQPLRTLSLPQPVEEPVCISSYASLIHKIEDVTPYRLGDEKYTRIYCASSSTNRYKKIKEGLFDTVYIEASDILRWRVHEPEKFISRAAYGKSSASGQAGNTIYTSRMTGEIRAAYVTNNHYLGGKVNVVTVLDEKYCVFVTCVLNSRLVNFWYRERYIMQHMQGGALPINTTDLAKIPYIMPDAATLGKIDALYARLADDEARAEDAINRIIYDLYGLSADEAAVVERAITGKA